MENNSDNKKSQQRFKTTRVVKEEGSHGYETGIKGGKTGSSYGGGVSKDFNGFGGVSINTASGLYVGYLNSREVLVSIKKDFTNAGICRITSKTLDAIRKTMPEFIRLEDGGVRVSSDVMTKWINDVKGLLNK